MARLKSNLKKLAKQAPLAAWRAAKKTGEDIASLASQLAPVDTGALRDSYRSEQVGESVLVGSDKEYAPYVEFGTTKQAAQPHLITAFAQSRETFLTHLKEEIRNDIG